MRNDYELCGPRAEALINSLRAFGYDLSMAIADLIDNSIFAKAKKIDVDWDWNTGKPWVRILDDGTGMSESVLKEAMRLGSQNPLDERKASDLGRFGLGLKTASFSQCKNLSVCSKTSSGQISTRSWDLDHVSDTDRWELAKKVPRKTASLLSVVNSLEAGTVVLWQNLDRLVGDGVNADEDGEHLFNARFRQVLPYLEMVFHRYLAGRERIQINVGEHNCKPWDPFLTGNNHTQRLPTETIGGNNEIEVIPYVLPHVSKRSNEETRVGAGLYGWNAQQGFYVYRNRRMIIPGGYLDFKFKPEEHYKLCRIEIDLPNNLDHEWGIDVRKAAAVPPGHVRNDLERIAKATREIAVSVYRARSGITPRTRREPDRYPVWLKEKRGEKIRYKINRKNEAISRILNEADVENPWIRKLFHLIENSVPHRVIILDNAEQEDCHVDLPEILAPPPAELLDLCAMIFQERLRLASDVDPGDAVEYACAFFDNHVAYRVHLETLIEGMNQ